MRTKLGWILAAGLLVAGCGAGPAPANSGTLGVLETPASVTATPTYSVPVTTAEAPTTTEVPITAPITTTAAAAVPVPTQAAAKPVTPKAVAPKPVTPKTTAAAKPKTTVQAPPLAQPAACGADYYRNSDGNCVHRPSSNPSGATAICNDGSYSYSQHHSGTCSGHGGVRTWL